MDGLVSVDVLLEKQSRDKQLQEYHMCRMLYRMCLEFNLTFILILEFS